MQAKEFSDFKTYYEKYLRCPTVIPRGFDNQRCADYFLTDIFPLKLFPGTEADIYQTILRHNDCWKELPGEEVAEYLWYLNNRLSFLVYPTITKALLRTDLKKLSSDYYFECVNNYIQKSGTLGNVFALRFPKGSDYGAVLISNFSKGILKFETVPEIDVKHNQVMVRIDSEIFPPNIRPYYIAIDFSPKQTMEDLVNDAMERTRKTYSIDEYIENFLKEVIILSIATKH